MMETKANTNTKIHVLADETLGGIKREYVEVDRKAEVGEKIIIVRPDGVIGDDYDTGRVGTVKSRHSAGDVSVETIGLVFGDEYRVLVPLDKHEKTLENKNSVYKEVKNYIHNELGISRQNAQEMISIAVSNEVQKMSESGKLDRIAGEKIESLIEEGFENGGQLLHGFKERVSQTVSDEVGKRIANVLNINVELKEEGN
ncbi:hypothetical protein HUN88_06015 [Bacillus amyloliquefaciens]|nr:hypothetical protein [Bacillus amyloliquefaciens]NUI59312.1 hypothetical protein [Bacillus amyloliquefaciens]